MFAFEYTTVRYTKKFLLYLFVGLNFEPTIPYNN